MRNPIETLKAWIIGHICATKVASEDHANFKAWLQERYQPIAGGWQY